MSTLVSTAQHVASLWTKRRSLKGSKAFRVLLQVGISIFLYRSFTGDKVAIIYKNFMAISIQYWLLSPFASISCM